MDPRALAAATPADRNRVVDFLRAAAILTVVLGHWLMAAVMVQDDQLVPNAVLNIAPSTHPLTWLFQVMPLFFIVGGYANGLSWRSARRRGDGYAGWLRSRLQRLAAPVLPLLLVWLAIASIGYAAGVPGGTLRTASQVALVPTWFLAAYIVVVALAPLLLALWERLGWWSIGVGLSLGGLVDCGASPVATTGSASRTTSWCGPPCTSSGSPGSTAPWPARLGASCSRSSGSPGW